MAVFNTGNAGGGDLNYNIFYSDSAPSLPLNKNSVWIQSPTEGMEFNVIDPFDEEKLDPIKIQSGDGQNTQMHSIKAC